MNNLNFKLVKFDNYEDVYDDQFCRIKSIVKNHLDGHQISYSSPSDSMKNDMMKRKINKFSLKNHVKHYLDDPRFNATFIKSNVEK